MNRIKIILILFLIAIASIAYGVRIAHASMHYFCPATAGIHGWWGYIAPSHRQCIDFFTWNTINGLSGEESWFNSDAHYLMCHYSSLLNPGNVASKVYIPYPDSLQTNKGAHYYKWASGRNYLIIGSVNQYSVFGYTNLSTVDWSQFDTLRLSDWTNDAVKYSKHVDLDQIVLDCYFN